MQKGNGSECVHGNHVDNCTGVGCVCPRPLAALLDRFDYFVLIYMPVLWLVGTLCNTLLILVFTGGARGARKVRNPNIVMFITIAVADILVVTVGLLSQLSRIWLKWSSRVEHVHVPIMRANLHPAYVTFATVCFLLEHACSEFSIWSECFLSCARFAAICWPHKLRTWLHYRGTVVTLVVLACCALFLRVPLFVAHLLAAHSSVAASLESTDPFFLLFLRFLLPVILLAITTHGILLGLRRSREQFGRTTERRAVSSGETVNLMPHRDYVPSTSDTRNGCTHETLRKNVAKTSSQSPDETNSSRDQVSLVRVTFVLVGKNVSYFVFVSTYIIVDLLWTFKLINKTTIATHFFTYSYILSYIHHITSFFICLAGGKAFREETLRIVKRCTGCGCHEQLAQHSITGKTCDTRSTFQSSL